ncbi:restriction endonuclease subunit S [Macellibacteroides fermentans]|uniref:restriction endonuclease subunit S n=1 Tax=Macellibacteroides fermentans TaxID=879969 RepID=UPI003B92642C
MSEWKEYKLGDVIVTNAKSITKDYPYKKIKYLDTGSITCNKIESLQDLNLTDAPSRAKRLVNDGDIIYSTVRPDQLHYGYITSAPQNLVVSTGFVTITCNKEIVNPKFLYYSLTQNQTTEFLHSIAEASTSTYPSLKPSDIEALDIILPPLPEQEHIASILSSLDDKIDLLNRQNQTLESMAEALFRNYFIENPKEEWKDGMLDDILSVKGGTTPSTANPDFWNGTICWSSPRDVTTLNGIYMFDTERKITEKGLSVINSGLLPKGTLLMSSRAPVGVLAFAEVELAINQGYIAILDNKGYSKEFIYLWLKTNMDSVHSFSNGSTFMEISKSAFKSLPLTIPPINLANLFQLEIKPLFDKIKYNQTQISTLSKLRNILLTRLMSGEVYTKITE